MANLTISSAFFFLKATNPIRKGSKYPLASNPADGRTWKGGDRNTSPVLPLAGSVAHQVCFPSCLISFAG